MDGLTDRLVQNYMYIPSLHGENMCIKPPGITNTLRQRPYDVIISKTNYYKSAQFFLQSGGTYLNRQRACLPTARQLRLTCFGLRL